MNVEHKPIKNKESCPKPENPSAVSNITEDTGENNRLKIFYFQKFSIFKNSL